MSSKLLDKNSLLQALSEYLSSPAYQKLFRLASDIGVDLYPVGGCIRDLALGKDPKELDLCSGFEAESLAKEFESRGVKVFRTGLKHGTILLIISEVEIEITSFRVLGDGKALGESLEEDLLARDFTINALAYSPQENKLIDPSGGLDDLERGALRCPTDAEKIFADDPLRVLRAARFVARYELEPNKELLSAAKSFVPQLADVSSERIGAELSALMLAKNPNMGLDFLKSIGALHIIAKELETCVGFEQNRYHVHDVYEHTQWVIERSKEDLCLRLAALFHDLGKPGTLSTGSDGERHFYKHEILSANIAAERLSELCFPKQLVHKVTRLVRYHMRPLDCGPSGARRLLRDLGEDFDDWLELKQADAPPVMPEDEFQNLLARFNAMIGEIQSSKQKLSLEISGGDLLKIGFEPGPRVGEVLRELEEHIMDSPDDNRAEVLLELAKKQLGTT